MPIAKTRPYTEADYYNLPEEIKAELIDGELIYDQSAPSRMHQTILSELHTVIHNYIKAKHGSCRIYPAPFAVKLKEDSKTIVEPDLSIICDSSKLTERGCTGAPDWIIEIVSPSTSSRDYVLKLNLYANTGVREYWIVDPLREGIFVYHLEQEHFEVETYTFRDCISVGIYPDLQIDFLNLDL